MEVKRKIVLLGDAAVGKTSLVRRFVYNVFDDRYIMTIGTKVSKKIIKMKWDDLDIDLKLMIWDVLGQQGFTRVQEAAFKGSDGALLVCDLTRKDTLYNISRYWLPVLERVAGVPAVLLANKSDLEGWEFTEDELNRYSQSLGVPYLLTSAKTGKNVEEAFHHLAELMFKFDPVTTSGEESESELETLKDALDYIMHDFCDNYGNFEDGMAVLTAHMKLVGIDVETPKPYHLINLVDRLYSLEKDYLGVEKAQDLRIKRLGIIKRVKWV